MTDISEPAELTVGPQGRIVIPAGMRRALGIDAGSKLIARIEDGHLVVETRAPIVARIRAQFRSGSRSGSLSDEMIAERRAEAEREAGD